MNKTDRFTDKEWEELASLLSEEKSEQTDLLTRFMDEDIYNTEKQWKELRNIKDWEYTNDRVPYIGVDRKQHTYLLDFKVFNNDNTFYYIETKGYEQESLCPCGRRYRPGKPRKIPAA